MQRTYQDFRRLACSDLLGWCFAASEKRSVMYALVLFSNAGGPLYLANAYLFWISRRKLVCPYEDVVSVVELNYMVLTSIIAQQPRVIP